MEISTFIKLDRNICKWRWFKNSNMLILWVYILTSANTSDQDFEKITVHRGEFVTSLDELCRATGLSPGIVRNSIDKLKHTGEIKVRSTNRYTVITVVNYNKYQGEYRIVPKRYEPDLPKSKYIPPVHRSAEAKKPAYDIDLALWQDFDIDPNSTNKII